MDAHRFAYNVDGGVKMSLLDLTPDVEYPESDGRPMGETDLHINCMFRLRDQLKYHFREQRVYVGCDLLVYYEKGNPQRFVVPDHFVVKDCETNERRTYKIWEEGNKPPDVVFEVTSRSSRENDLTVKPSIYAQIGVQEYFLYDPTQEYLVPPLQGFRMKAGKYVRIKPNRSGALACHELNLLLRLEKEEERTRRFKLVIIDAQTGQSLPTLAEANQTRADTERARADAEHQARLAAEVRAQRAETELRYLRDTLGKQDQSGESERSES
jgi:Uma2 family endonuclease